MTWRGPDLVVWLVVVAAGLGTFAIRLSFIELFGWLDEVPDPVERALTYVPPAVLAALVVPELLLVDGGLALGPGNPKLLAGGVATLVAWRTGNLALTLVAGMVAIWTLSYLA